MNKAIGTELKAKADVAVMSVDEFKIMITDKKSTVMLIENNVIELKDWDQFHPGGKFVLHKNFGRDVTKYWYGGYQMIDHYRDRRHSHSFMAT